MTDKPGAQADAAEAGADDGDGDVVVARFIHGRHCIRDDCRARSVEALHFAPASNSLALSDVIRGWLCRIRDRAWPRAVQASVPLGSARPATRSWRRDGSAATEKVVNEKGKNRFDQGT